MKKQYLLFFALFFLVISVSAQRGGGAPQSTKPYSYIIKGGHVIDAKNNIDAIMDVAISNGTRDQRAFPARPAANGQPARPATPAVVGTGGKIALIAKTIDPKLADKIINATGLYVTPGLIDLHTHVFWGHDGSSYMNAPASIPPDPLTFRTGVTTVVDAGSSGWESFELFKKQTIDQSQTRVLAMLNIHGPGMCCGESDISQMDGKKTAAMAMKYPDIIVGIKTAHVNNNGQRWVAVDRAEEAGRIANIPIMVDFGSGNPYLPLDSLFNVKFRPGDIYTHCFGGDEGEEAGARGGRESIIDVVAGKVKPYVYKARQRGIIFDVGFGGGSYWYRQGYYAMKEGFFPNSISTDLHTGSMNSPMKSMENIMSLFVATGMPLKEVIKASTWNPAQEIKRTDLGNLSVGSVGDIAIFSVSTGKYGFPVRGGKIAGTKRLTTEMTIRAGQVVYDLNGLSEPVGPTPDKPLAQQGGRGASPQAPR